MTTDQILVPYNPNWPKEFRIVGDRLRTALGPVARRIDHVGSTAVPNLDAKPMIDVQLSVQELVPMGPYRRPLELLGYIWESQDPDLTNRYFDEAPDSERPHIHVRRQGSLEEQLNLLFRDYLRENADVAKEYGRLKWELADQFKTFRKGYFPAKRPKVWSLMLGARHWAQETGWFPGPSDA